MVMTEDTKLRRRAARKAAKIQKREIDAAGPLFADQVELQVTTPEDEYWKIRRSWALAPRGHEAAYLGNVDYRWDLSIIRKLAMLIMSESDFEIADGKSDRFGSVMDFWKNIMIGQRRIVIDYTVVSHGWKPCWRDPETKACCQDGCSKCESVLICYIEQRTMTERLVWPPEGYHPPLTKEQLDKYLELPLPQNFPGAVDPLGLGVEK